MPSVERLRQLLFLLALALAAAAAWWGGVACFRDPPLDAVLLSRKFEAAQAPQAAQRDDRTLEAFQALTGRRLVAAPPAVPVPVGPPPFKLLGTSHNPMAPQDPTAMVSNSKGDARTYKVGETVEVDEAKLVRVYGPRARFLWKGREVELGPEGPFEPTVVVPPPGEAAPPEQTDFSIAPIEWAAIYGNLAALWNQVEVQANIVNSQKQGLKVMRMDEKFPARKYGVRVGDVVQKVNGVSVNDIVSLGTLLGKLKDPQTLSIEVERAGRRFTLTVKAEVPTLPSPVPPKP